MKSPAHPTPLDQQIVLAPGQSKDLAEGLRVGFVEVISDSRCPADAICIAPGEAIVRVDIAAGATRGQRDLHTDNRPVLVDGVRLELLELSPYPLASRPAQPSDYRARLRITR